MNVGKNVGKDEKLLCMIALGYGETQGYTQMDLGIAKYHFELGAGTDNFDLV